MKNIFLKYYFCGVLKYIQKGNENDYEKELNLIGKDIGQRIALLYHFKREKEIESLLYKLVFTLLPSIYQANRRIEKSSDPKILYYIYENEPIFEDFNYKDQLFCPSSIIAGVIEVLLEISGFNFKVIAYNNTDETTGVIYTIEKGV